jgi:4-amino-4-deoxy-L-arabinose transferase-like glycosyltransferase
VSIITELAMTGGGSFVSRIPSLWRDCLFCGPADGDSRVRFPHLILLLILPAVLLYPCLSHHLLEPDEGRYAQIPREMVETGDWVVPTLQSEAYLDKPPLMYWLVAESYQLFGVSIPAARLVPALCVHLTILSVYLIGRRGLGSRAAFWASLLLTVSPGFLEMGRLLILDGLLTLCVTGSLLCGFEAVREGRFKLSWWLAAAVCSGLGFLTKGPIAEVLLFPPMLVVGWLSGRFASVGWWNYLLFGAVVLAVSLPWYVAMYRREPAFLKYFFVEHNLMRFLQPFDHLQPVWYYMPVIVGGFLPGTLFAVPFLKSLLFGSPDRADAPSPSCGFWLAAGLWCLAFFSASGSKLPTYILPAFPPLCLALGEFISRGSGLRKKWAAGSIAIFAGLLLVANFVVIPKYAKARSPVGNPDLVLPYVNDPAVPVVTYPRTVDSLAFAVGRRDFDRTRSKDANQMILDSHFRPKTVILFTHRHSFEAFAKSLPPSVTITDSVSLQRNGKAGLWDRILGDSPWGLCDIAVIQPTQPVAASVAEK